MDDIWKWLGEQTGNILGVLGVVTGFIFYWVSRKPKRFGWEVVSQSSIINRESGHLPLQVLYDGKEVLSPNLLVMRLLNLGKSEIRAGDFDGPIFIKFAHSRILSSAVKCATLSPGATRDDDTVSLTPSLLNPGEWVELQLVTDGPAEVPDVRARIAGQSGPTVDIERTFRRRLPHYMTTAGKVIRGLTLVGIVLTCVMLLMAILILWFRDIA